MPSSQDAVITASSDPRSLSRGRGVWQSFGLTLVGTCMAILAALYASVLVVDPFGLRVGSGHPPGALMDLNQRWMYPQLARSRLYDGALFGSSTIRLLDPRAVGTAFGARVANLGMNAATPWEQVRLADLYLRETPDPKIMIFGLDRNWCDENADSAAKLLTFRSFPRPLYGARPLSILPDLFNLKSVEIAWRALLNRAGLMRERIRLDGYEVFTPPETSYDLARARAHIWAGTPGRVVPLEPAYAMMAGELLGLRLPALDWLRGLVARIPATTRLVLVLPPIHVAAQAAPGSREEAVDGACKARVAAIGAARGATVIDFRRSTALTADDANYWDSLHYRLGIAGRIVEDLKRAAETGEDAVDGSYRVLKDNLHPILPGPRSGTRNRRPSEPVPAEPATDL